MFTRGILSVSAACLCAALLTSPAVADGKKGTAVIKGKVVLDEATPPPKIKPLDMKADATCQKQHATPQADQGLIVYKDQGNAVPYVFCYVKKGADEKYDVPATPVVIDQKGCVYHPHVMGMIAGQGMDILNSDPVNHNIHSLAKKNPQFNFAQPQQNMKKELRGNDTFTKPEVMAKVKCDVHGWMSSYVGVLTHPFFSVTKDHEAAPKGKEAERGTFEIKELPAGKYEIEFWHETFGVVTQEVEVKDGETKELTVKIGGKKALAPTFRQVDLASMSSEKKPSCCSAKNHADPAAASSEVTK